MRNGLSFLLTLLSGVPVFAHYAHPNQCRIREAEAWEREKLAAVGYFESPESPCSTQLIKSSELGLKGDRQIVVLNKHCLEDENSLPRAVPANGLVDPALFKVVFPACGPQRHAVTRICPGSVGATYQKQQHMSEDYMFAEVGDAICQKAIDHAIEFSEFSREKLFELLSQKQPVTLSALYGENESCQKNAAGEYVESMMVQRGLRKLHLSSGVVTEVDKALSSSMFTFSADSLYSSSGGFVYVDLKTTPTVIGLAKGEGQKTRDNFAIRIDARMMRTLRNCMDPKLPVLSP